MRILVLCIIAIVLILGFKIYLRNNRKKESVNNQGLSKPHIADMQSNQESISNNDEEKVQIKPISDNNTPTEIFSTEESTTSITHEEVKVANLVEELVTQETKYVIPVTTGESEFYKEKLQDPRWIEKRNKIKQRDKYVCQHCLNIKSLSSLDELDKYMDDYSEEDGSKIAQVIKEVFKEREQQIDKNECINIGKDYYEDLSKRTYIIKHHLYQYSMYDSIFDNMNSGTGGYGYLYCDTNVTFKSIISKHITLNEKIPFKKKDKFGETQSLLVTYSPEATTCGQLLLRALFPLKVNGLEYNGVGQLSLDEYSIFFPLYNLNRFKDALEVHHTKYPQSGLPWDIDDELLTTLCHSCHMKEHN